MSVNRLHCYVQYSTLISCCECREHLFLPSIYTVFSNSKSLIYILAHTSLIIVRFWCSLHHWKALDLLFQNITSICIWYNVVSVDQLHCYVQYSTLVSCRECRQMHIDVIFWKRRSRAFQWCKLHQNWTIIKEVTSQNVHSNAMSSVSKMHFNRFSMLINTVHSNVVSVDRCI